GRGGRAEPCPARVTATGETCGPARTGPTPDTRCRRVPRDCLMLEVEKLSAYYGKKQVLFDVDLTLGDGAIAALIGPNGAGKSTVLRAIFGLGPRRDGVIRFDGRDVSRAAPSANVPAGIVFVPQGARVFRDLTVDENLLMA